MGNLCSSSKPKAAVAPSYKEPNEIDSQLKRALRQVLNSSTHKTHGFNKILLGFPRIQSAFLKIRGVFNDLDTGKRGTIYRSQMGKCMERLGSTLPSALLHEMFLYSQPASPSRKGLSSRNSTEGSAALASPSDAAPPSSKEDTLETSLTWREFVVSLAVGSVLHLLPLMEGEGNMEGGGADTKALGDDQQSQDAQSSAGTSDAPLDRLAGSAKEVATAMHLVLEAWVLFDKDGSGSIDKDEVLALLSTHAHENNHMATGKSTTQGKEEEGVAFLSKSRWQELGGTTGIITFREFVVAMITWVGADEDADEEEGEEVA
jgi:hypothetical protein